MPTSLACLLLLFICSPRAGADSVDQWLMRINDAAANLSYEGIFVAAFGSSLETMQAVHHVRDGVVRERLYSLNGAPREIVRDAEQVWCYVPERNIGLQEFRQMPKQSFPNILPQRLGRLGENYTLSLGREDRVADRKTQQLIISPRDDYRYGYVLWADRETGLLLKAALVDGDGEPVEQYMFTAVTIGDTVNEAELVPVTAREDLQWFKQDDAPERPVYEEAAGPGWEVADLPDGFEISRRIRRTSPINKRTMEHYVYSDGLAAVSVFIEALEGEENAALIDGVTRIGAVHAFGATQDGHQITVVGAVPARTVDKIGASAKRMTE